MALTMVVAYDVSRDDRRARLAALLQTWGDRIQYSVFLISIAEEDLGELVERVSGIIEPREDSVCFLRQCKSCWEVRRELGQGQVQPDTLYWAAL